MVSGNDGIENWMSRKDISECPVWHLPDGAELAFANHLLSLHLEGPLADLRSICEDKQQEESSGNASENSCFVLEMAAFNTFSHVAVQGHSQSHSCFLPG